MRRDGNLGTEFFRDRNGGPKLQQNKGAFKGHTEGGNPKFNKDNLSYKVAQCQMGKGNTGSRPARSKVLGTPWTIDKTSSELASSLLSSRSPILDDRAGKEMQFCAEKSLKRKVDGEHCRPYYST